MRSRSEQTSIGEALQRPDLEPTTPVEGNVATEQTRLFVPAPEQIPGQMTLERMHAPNAPGPGPLQR